jgi:hypothetical protein
MQFINPHTKLPSGLPELTYYISKNTPLPESARKLYRPSSLSLSAKLVLTFPDRGVPRDQRDGSLRPYSRLSRPQPLRFLPSSSSIVVTRLTGPRSRPLLLRKFRIAGNLTWTSGSVARDSDHKATQAATK